MDDLIRFYGAFLTEVVRIAKLPEEGQGLSPQTIWNDAAKSFGISPPPVDPALLNAFVGTARGLPAGTSVSVILTRAQLESVIELVDNPFARAVLLADIVKVARGQGGLSPTSVFQQALKDLGLERLQSAGPEIWGLSQESLEQLVFITRHSPSDALVDEIVKALPSPATLSLEHQVVESFLMASVTHTGAATSADWSQMVFDRGRDELLGYFGKVLYPGLTVLGMVVVPPLVIGGIHLGAHGVLCSDDQPCHAKYISLRHSSGPSVPCPKCLSFGGSRKSGGVPAGFTMESWWTCAWMICSPEPPSCHRSDVPSSAQWEVRRGQS